MGERERFESWYAEADPERRCAFERLVSDTRYTSMEVEWAYRAWQARADLAAEREQRLVEALRALYHFGAEDGGFMDSEEWEKRWPAWRDMDEWEIAREALATHEHNEGES